jgi:hypothetical protein
MSLPHQTPIGDAKSKSAGATVGPVSADAPQIEEDLAALLDEQATRLKKRRRRANWVILAFFGLMMGSASAWYAKSEVNRQKVADLILDIKSSGKDFKMIGNAVGMADQYDDALKEIGTRATDIDHATASLGVDPTTVEEDGMDAEMKEMMGGKGQTVNERNKLLKGKLGAFAEGQVRIQKRKDAEAAAKAQKDAPAAKPAAVKKPVAQPAAPVVHDEPLILR